MIRRQALQRGQQRAWVVIHRPHAIVPKQRGEHTLQHLAVRQHVRHAAGHAKIVFQHGKLAVRQPHQIGAANAHVDVAWHIDATHFAPEMLATVNEFAGNDFVGENSAFVINIAQKQIQRGQPLRQTFLDSRPFCAR